MPIQTNERFQYAFASFFQQFFRITDIDKATRNDIRSCQRKSSLFIDGKNNHENAVLRQHLAIAQHNLPNISYTKPIYEHITASNMFPDFNRIAGHFDNISIFGDNNMIFLDAKRTGLLGME